MKLPNQTVKNLPNLIDEKWIYSTKSQYPGIISVFAHHKRENHVGLIGKLLQPFWRLTRGQTLGAQGVIFDTGNSVLLVRHGYRPGWHFPGGGVEKDETVLAGLSREIREETGIQIGEDARFHGLFANFKAFPGDHVALFIIRDWQRRETPAANAEILEQKFFPADDLPDGARPPVRRRLDEILHDHPVNQYW